MSEPRPEPVKILRRLNHASREVEQARKRILDLEQGVGMLPSQRVEMKRLLLTVLGTAQSALESLDNPGGD